MTTRIEVVKLLPDGREAIRYPAELVADDGREMRLRACWGHPTRDLGYVVLEPGDRWTEWYYRDRWYNILEIRAEDGELKGWYCNVTRPATLADGELRYVDLVLDLFVYPSGQLLRLDEDEFEALDLPSQDPEAYREARTALQELEGMVGRGEPPFEKTGGQAG